MAEEIELRRSTPTVSAAAASRFLPSRAAFVRGERRVEVGRDRRFRDAVKLVGIDRGQCVDFDLSQGRSRSPFACRPTS